MNAVYARLAAWRPTWSPTIFRAVLVSMFVLAFAVPITIVALPFNEFMNDMAAQPKGKTQMTFGRTYDKDGFGMVAARDPVAGTVPRNYTAYALDHLGKDPQSITWAGQLQSSPLPVTKANMLAGQKSFTVYCVPCHGVRAMGDGPVTGPNRFPAPPSLHTDRARDYADGSIFHIITKGTEIMPGYADKLDPTERWQVIQYVRALQRAENPRPEDMR